MYISNYPFKELVRCSRIDFSPHSANSLGEEREYNISILFRGREPHGSAVCEDASSMRYH